MITKCVKYIYINGNGCMCCDVWCRCFVRTTVDSAEVEKRKRMKKQARAKKWNEMKFKHPNVQTIFHGMNWMVLFQRFEKCIWVGSDKSDGNDDDLSVSNAFWPIFRN